VDSRADVTGPSRTVGGSRNLWQVNSPLGLVARCPALAATASNTQFSASTPMTPPLQGDTVTALPNAWPGGFQGRVAHAHTRGGPWAPVVLGLARSTRTRPERHDPTADRLGLQQLSESLA